MMMVAVLIGLEVWRQRPSESTTGCSVGLTHRLWPGTLSVIGVSYVGCVNRQRISGLDRLTADEVEQGLIAAELEIARLRHVQVALVREADQRQIPLGDGARTLTDWVSSRLDVTPETARALARVARHDSSSLDEVLVAGVAGFDRVSEVARSDDDQDLALHLDIGGIRRRVARHRRVTRDEEIRSYGSRSLSYQRDMFGAVGRLWAEGPALETDAMFTAIEQATDDLPVSPVPEPRAARRFDGLNALVFGEAEHTVNTTVIVDAADAVETNGEAGGWVVSGARVGPHTLERVLCESTVEVTARTADGVPLAVGSAQTAIPARTRRFVQARDGGVCVADGCGSGTRVQPHHVQHRGHHGNNDPDNLASLCWFHHHVVIHGRGFRIDPNSPPLRRRFLPPGDDRTERGSTDPP